MDTIAYEIRQVVLYENPLERRFLEVIAWESLEANVTREDS